MNRIAFIFSRSMAALLFGLYISPARSDNTQPTPPFWTKFCKDRHGLACGSTERRASTPQIDVHTASKAVDQVRSDLCPQPIYRGIKSGALMRFFGDTGAKIYREHGSIQTASPKHVFEFSTTHSNGYPREYLTLGGFKNNNGVTSVVVRKNLDLSNAEGPAPFLLTPDLVANYHYATNQEGQEALHALILDDTWKLIGCGQNLFADFIARSDPDHNSPQRPNNEGRSQNTQEDQECFTVSSKQIGTKGEIPIYEGHAVCKASACTPDQRVGAHWRCPVEGNPIGPWEYVFSSDGTKWRLLNTGEWHFIRRD